MKNNVRRNAALVLLLLLTAGLFTACNGTPVEIGNAGNEKLIQVLYSAEKTVAEDASATLTHVETGEVLSAAFDADLRSFCFTTETLGLYELNVTNGTTKISPRYVEITKDQSYYLLPIVAVE